MIKRERSRSPILGVLVFVIVAGIVGGIVLRQHNTPVARRDQLLTRFLACVPDSLDGARRAEIRGLVEGLWRRYDRGNVDAPDYDEILGKMQSAVAAGNISGKDLVFMMAQVGYYTYKMDPRYNLESGEVDHPELNPKAGMVSLGDSSFWADYAAWVKEHGDSVMAEIEKGNAGP